MDKLKENIRKEMSKIQSGKQHDLAKAKLDQHEITKEFYLQLCWDIHLGGKSSGEIGAMLEDLDE